MRGRFGEVQPRFVRGLCKRSSASFEVPQRPALQILHKCVGMYKRSDGASIGSNFFSSRAKGLGEVVTLSYHVCSHLEND